MKKILSVAISLLIFMGGFLVVTGGNTGSFDSVNAEQTGDDGVMKWYTVHAPIRIDSDSDLASAAGSGSGTQSDPYVISGYSINGTGYGYCIYVGNTSDYFTIKDCYLYEATGGSGNLYFSNSEVITYDVQNGDVENNIMKFGDYGIYFYGTDYSKIYTNNIENASEAGIYTYNTYGNSICGNTLYYSHMKGMSIYYTYETELRSNNVTKSFDYGMYMYHSYLNEVSQNSFHDNYGDISFSVCDNITTNDNAFNDTERSSIYFSDSKDMEAYGNTISADVNSQNIYLSGSDRISVHNNYVDSQGRSLGGIGIRSSKSVEIYGNNLTTGCIYLDGDQMDEWNTHSIAPNNTIGGKPIYYFRNASSAVVPSDAAQVILANCTGISVDNLSMHDIAYPVQIGFSNNIKIVYNYISDPYYAISMIHSESINTTGNRIIGINRAILSDHTGNSTISGNSIEYPSIGIYLYYSYGMNLTNNEVYDCEDALYILYSENNTIYGNEIHDNSNYGAYLYASHGNRIFHNDFIYNINPAYEEENGANHWNGTYGQAGNYWDDYTGKDIHCGPNQDQSGSDGIGDTPYSIDGSSSSADNYPLMERIGSQKYECRAPIRINSDADFDSDHGVVSGSGTASDPYILRDYMINGTGYGYCVYIGNTTDNFILSNSRFHDADGGSGSEYYNNASVILHNVSNGVVKDNEMWNAKWAIYMDWSANTNMTNNSISDVTYGIYADHSSFISVENSTFARITYTALEAEYSSYGRFMNNSFGDESYNRAISLYYSDNILIKGNTMRDTGSAVYLLNSYHNDISNNTAISISESIILYQSSNNRISGNTIEDPFFSSMRIESSSDNVLSQNNIIEGFYGDEAPINLVSSSRIHFYQNKMPGMGIRISGSYLEDWNTHEIPPNNTIGGKPIYYFKNLTAALIPQDAGQIIIANCSDMAVNGYDLRGADPGVSMGFSRNISVTDSLFLSSDEGIYMKESYGISISGNNISNSFNGIYVENSGNLEISDNELYRNSHGIYFSTVDHAEISGNSISEGYSALWIFYMENCSITENTVSGMNGPPIRLYDSDYNEIYHNNFMGSGDAAYDNSRTNIWNSGYWQGGNYWWNYAGADSHSGKNQDQPGADGIGDTVYSNISGDAGALDEYPLMQPFSPLRVETLSGWNLITLSWLRYDISITDALSGSSWDRAMVFVGGTWYTYNTNRDAKFNLDFPMVNSGMGIWVNFTAPDILTGPDMRLGNVSIDLHAGWNLVGYPSTHDAKVSDSLAGIPWEHVKGADAHGDLYELSSRNYLLSGSAYWIYVTEDCTWTVEW